ncbi:MAG: HD domain-containing phosphohydrolase [Gemmatimonadales bacterium]
MSDHRHSPHGLPEPPPTTEPGRAFTLSELISSLSYALDLTEGQAMGHSARSCVIGMRIASAIGLGADERLALFYALLLKDAGCSSNSARLAELFGNDDLALKRDVKLIDWTRLLPSIRYALSHARGDGSPLGWLKRAAAIGQRAEEINREMTATRCDRGADIVRMLGMPPATVEAIRTLDEHWDGSGQPLGLSGGAIPVLGRILCLAQTFEVFLRDRGLEAAYGMLVARRGRWFDPELVRCLETIRSDREFWSGLMRDDPLVLARRHEPEDREILADDARVDQVAEAFAQVIDAKSPYTYRHSEGVAAIAVQLAEGLGMPAAERRELRRAALLHDIGKLGVSNAILDKPGKLDEAEWAAMRRHPAYTFEILDRVKRFQPLAEMAASHHERMDGNGYHRGLPAARLSRPARIIAVADVTEALLADRPYRKGLGWDRVLAIVEEMAGPALCPECCRVLKDGDPPTTARD